MGFNFEQDDNEIADQNPRDEAQNFSVAFDQMVFSDHSLERAHKKL